MKLSIVLSIQNASFSALAYKGQWAKNIGKIAGIGYDGVELAVRDPQSLDMHTLKSILAKYHLPVPAIGTGQAFGEEGLSFTHPEVSVRRQAIERIKLHIGLAKKLGAVIIIGLIRGRRGTNVNEGQAEEWLIEALRECALENNSVKLAVEPINRYETNLINTAASAMKLVEKVKMENVGLLLDTFHMNVEEPSITESIISGKDRLFHFHVADSNRWYPGAGHIDFKAIFNTLAEIQYTGFVSAEILPLPDSDTAAKKTIDFLRELLTKK